MSLRALPSCLALLALGCSHTTQLAPAPDWGIARASTSDTFEIGGQASHWGVRVTDNEVLGVSPDFALSRDNGEIRGRAQGVPVVVGFHGDEAAGVYRAAPFELKVERTPDGMRVQGLVGGAISSYEISTDRISGRVGTCGWDVRWDGSAYSGSRGCGSTIQPISVSLPATLARWSDVEVAGALALLLNVGAPVGLDRLADNSAEFREAPVPDPVLAPYHRMAYAANAVRLGGGTLAVGRSASGARAPAPVRMPARSR